jgi:hypothetical protein
MRIAALLLVGTLIPFMGYAQVPYSESQLNAGATPAHLLACPQGDTPSFGAQGWSIDVWVYDHEGGTPVQNWPASDFWLTDCDPLSDAALCGGDLASNADAPTDAAGWTQFSTGTLQAGGCVEGIQVWCSGLPAVDITSGEDNCYPSRLRSPDIDGSLTVSLGDLSIFASSYPPNAPDPCCDMDGDGMVSLIDLVRFAEHYGPPGHFCP